MKKSKIFLSIAFTLAIAGAVFSNALESPIAWIQQDATTCAQVSKPNQCLQVGKQICTILDVEYFQDHTEDGTTCLTPYFRN